MMSLELESFRGFAAPEILDFDAETVLVRGDNGTGKTSIADGLLWLMTGEIPRLRDRGKGIRKEKADPVVNRYRQGEKARVKLKVRPGTLGDEGGSEPTVVFFERSGDSKNSTLTVERGDESLVGPEAERLMAATFGDFTPQQFTHAVGAWGILQQHALLEALEGGTSMHERLAEIVGLERVNRFADSAAAVARAARAEQKSAEQARDRLRTKQEEAIVRLREAQKHAEHVQARAVPVSRLLVERDEDLQRGVKLERAPSEFEDLLSLLREIEKIGQAARVLAVAFEELAAASETGAEAIDAIERRLEGMRVEADRAMAQAPAQVQMADAALQLLGGDCPVCGQEIDESSVREHLNEMLESAREESGRAAAARLELGEAEVQLQKARLADARRSEAQERVDSARESLRAMIDAGGWVSVDPSLLSAGRAQELTEILESLEDRVQGAQTEARMRGGEKIVRYSTDLEVTVSESEGAEEKARVAKERADQAAGLDEAAHKAAERIVERALERLQPSLAEVFDRLSPHPTFKELQAKQDIYFRKNRVVPYAYDRKNEVGGHPALIFSEGQLNVVALSYFLGLALNAGEGALPFIVLDDTLAAMDVLNVLGFADLCRRLREERQLIVTTHDRRFAGLLKRKLAPREEGSRTVLLELDGWTEKGPQVRTQHEPMGEVLPLPERRAS
ncbi:MAG TPA: AAA family ATPase [Solirubrobacterales bacterium]